MILSPILTLLEKKSTLDTEPSASATVADRVIVEPVGYWLLREPRVIVGFVFAPLTTVVCTEPVVIPPRLSVTLTAIWYVPTAGAVMV